MTPPKELIDAIKKWCEENEMGMSAIFAEDFGAIVFGSGNYHPDQVNILVAHILLEGVIDGTWSKQNEELREEAKKKVM